MEKIIVEPQIIQMINNKIIRNRNKIVKTMGQHFRDLDKVYKDIIRSKRLV